MKSVYPSFCLFLLIGFIIISASLNAQITTNNKPDKNILSDTANYPHWIEMMQNPNTNFFETQKAFYKYFENRDKGKGTGYKQFKRWEYRMETRVSSEGVIPAADNVWNNFKEYQTSHPLTQKSTTAWTELGPRILINNGGYNGLGRINSLAFHPVNQNIIFIGAPSGGLWISSDGGENWTTHTDDLPSLGVSDIQINYNNPDTMYIGTGDRDGGASYGMGIMKSYDGGINWEFKKEGLGNTTINMMVMHNTNPNIITAATGFGIYQTVDAAESWSLKSVASDFKDIKYKPGDMNVMYATKTGDFYKSVDGGETWSESGQATLPDDGRFVIGVSSANDSVVYVGVASSQFIGLYESRDFGETFTMKSDSPNIMGYSVTGDDDRSQSFYDFCIAVDPDNDSIIHIGGINLWRSDDAGVTWNCKGHWTGADVAWEIHADQHTMAYSPSDGKLYVGNDGGIYVSADNGENWAELSDGLGISQVYKIGQSASWKEKVINGYQDNGTMTYIGTLLVPWMATGGGDGMECAIDYSNANISYSTVYYGSITRWHSNSTGVRVAGEGVNGIDETGAWITPFCLHETDPNTMFVGYYNIWRSSNIKESRASDIVWEQISRNLGTNTQTIRVVEHSPININIFYFGRRDNSLFRTENIMAVSPKEPIWVNLTDSLPNNSRPTDLEAHPFDENILYMTQSNRVYKSYNKGNSWENISGSLPNVSMNDIAYDLSSNEGIYVASDAGVYFKNGTETDWVLYGSGLPTNVSVEEIEIYYDSDSREESIIRVCTYGRGLWEIPLGPFNGVVSPYKLIGEAGISMVDLTWEKPVYQENILGFNIYRNGNYLDFTTITEYTDLSAVNDSTYTYYITTIKEGGGESEPSNIITATPKGAITLPYSEDFENGDGDWIYSNTKADWRLGTAEELKMEHINGNQTHFFGINSANNSQSTHVTDTLISPIFDLSPYTHITLSFYYVLRKYMTFDRLFVLYRTSENSMWEEIEELDKTGSWDSWENHSVNLPSEAISPTTQIAFYYDDSNEFAWGAGIDSVQLYRNTTGIDENSFDKEIHVFPNPNNGEFEVSFSSKEFSDVLISVFNIEGKIIFEKNYKQINSEFRHKLSLANVAKGNYQIRIICGNKIAYRKITLQ
ncbi:T9SS type A sorting domain-containing protein [Bacteroidota bacterium]